MNTRISNLPTEILGINKNISRGDSQVFRNLLRAKCAVCICSK